VRNALAYILLNARRHLAKKRCPPPRPTIDPASSGRFFSDWNRRIQPKPGPSPPPVAAPHTWLLRIGWRRHGLLDPSETPGSSQGRP
jgi:hypothetical protein